MARRLRIGAFGMSRRDFLKGAAGVAAVWGTGCQVAKPHMNFYNWSLYIGPDTLSDFEKATGVLVNYDEFSSADVLYAKIKIGVTGYDLVVAPGFMVQRLRRQKLLFPLPSKAPREALLPLLQSPPWDPQLEYSFPYLWGTTGIAYQKDKVANPKHSWDLLWDPKLDQRITVLDEKRDAIGAALFRLGFSGNSVDPTQLDQAKASLIEQKKLLRLYSSDVLGDLVRKETYAALAWSGDSHQAQTSNADVDFFIPAEGSFVDVDNMCIPRTAGNPKAAMDFINFYAQGSVAAAVTNARGYATPIAAALPLVEAALRQDPIIFPSPESMKNCVFQADLGAGEKLWNQIWEELKR